MGSHSAESGFRPAGATKAPDHAIPGRQPGAEAQGLDDNHVHSLGI
jgi:hypothetical protein